MIDRLELIARLRVFAREAWVEREGACFLVNPGWGERERGQWAELAAQRPENWDGRRGWLCIPTGGSSGAIKLARHDEFSLGAAALAFAEHFEVGRVNVLGLLPAWHVSGVMAWARCLWTGGAYRALAWKEVERGAQPAPTDGEFLSLVPTQLARLLAAEVSAADWLRGFRAVLLGGGPAWPGLLEQARAARVPVALCYGMTETAALVAAQRPREFLAGDDSCGQALPHARLRTDEAGRIEVAAASLFSGYWPGDRAPGEWWRTDDLGEIDAAGRVRVRGRSDALIISGGEKVNPAEVEAAVRRAGGDRLVDVAVLGLPHSEWGSEVIACYVGEAGMESGLRAGMVAMLAAAKRPKRYLRVPAEVWPRDARGKLDRAALGVWAGGALGAAHTGRT